MPPKQLYNQHEQFDRMDDEGSAFERRSSGLDRERLLEEAIGDSVIEPLLFGTEFHPRFDGVKGGLPSKLPDVVQQLLRMISSQSVLNRPPADFLNPEADEQPHFIFYSSKPIEVENNGEKSTHAPEGYLSLAIVTGERILFLVGQSDDDTYAFCEYDDIDAVFYNDEVDDPYLSVHADAQYTVRDCQPTSELTKATDYINEEAITVEQRASTGTTVEGTAESGRWSNTRNYASENARKFTEGIDPQHVFKCGLEAAAYGKKAKVGGAKGVAVSFAIGSGYGIYDCFSTDGETIGAPDPESLGETASQWRQEAASENEPTTWAATAMGIASEFATHNDNSSISTLLAEVDPSTGVAALESGVQMIDTTSSDLVSADGNPLDSLSAAELPQSVDTFSGMSRELFDADLLERLHAVSADINKKR